MSSSSRFLARRAACLSFLFRRFSAAFLPSGKSASGAKYGVSGALRFEMGEPGTSLASDWSARERERVLRRDLPRLPEKERRRADDRLERVPSVVVDSLSEEEEEEDEEEDEPVEEVSESELEDELEPSPKKARRRAIVIPRPEPELDELDELEDEEEEDEDELLELLESALLRAELRLARLLREPRRVRDLREPDPRRPRWVRLR